MHMLRKNLNITDVNSNEHGFASMVIGLVLIVVLGLMTIGFAELARHEQQQALNNQLSTQAFYSAETGINDVKKVLTDPALATLAAASPGKCLDDGALSAITGKSSTIGDTANGFSYTCVKIDLQTKEILFGNVPADQGRSIVTTTNPAGLTSLTFAWKPDGADVAKTAVRSGAIGTFTPKASWASPAVIQLSITPLGGGYDRASLIANTYTAYLYPDNSGATASYSAGGVGMASGRCRTAAPIVAGYECSSVIGMSGTTGPYLIHFLNLYSESSVQITGNNNAATFSGGQAMIDVTGKAKNVLKRLQVRVPIQNGGSDLSNYAIEAQDICKRMTTQPTSTDFWNPDNSQANSGDVCYPY